MDPDPDTSRFIIRIDTFDGDGVGPGIAPNVEAIERILSEALDYNYDNQSHHVTVEEVLA